MLLSFSVVMFLGFGMCIMLGCVVPKHPGFVLQVEFCTGLKHGAQSYSIFVKQSPMTKQNQVVRSRNKIMVWFKISFLLWLLVSHGTHTVVFWVEVLHLFDRRHTDFVALHTRSPEFFLLSSILIHLQNMTYMVANDWHSQRKFLLNYI